MSESQESQPAGRGRLTEVIATRGGLAPPEAPFVIEHREALIYMLCEAAELEHGIMCQYLYAAFTLKQSEAEGLTREEAAAVNRWRRQISHVATQEMLHLSLVQNLLSAIGGAPHLSRPNFPQPASHYPAGVHLALLPFGDEALRHFMFLERPEGMDIEDAAGMAAFRRAAPAVQEGDIVPRGQDFATVGHLYRSIEAGIAHLADKYGERWLFVGPPRAQATQQYFSWPELIAVTGAASAQRAIDEILEQGEGPRGHWQNAHFGQFVAILDEYIELREANPAFEPVRPSIPVNVRPAERDLEVALVTDPLTRRTMDLFNVSYEILLTMLQRFFAHTEETDVQLKALADATVALMFGAIKPLGELVTTLPAGPEYPGRTAGPSFELFYESDYVLPHREAAWILLIERLEQAAEFCTPGGPCEPGVADGLETIRATLTGIAGSLAAHLPARDVRPAPDPAPAEDLERLLARAEDFYRTAHIPAPRDSDLPARLGALLSSVYQAIRSQHDVRVVARLVNSVLRPLAQALSGTGTSEPAPADAPLEPAPADAPPTLWDVTVAATRLRADLAAAPAGLLEAVAALQDIACRQVAPGERPQRIAALQDAQRAAASAIVTAKNGPYLATNVPVVRTPFGEDLSLPPQLALCRCGASAMKPFCDGTHAGNGFTDSKDPHRVPDQRDTYAGEQVTVFDNRGICQHSGLCTDRLATVFRTGTEPFVAPSGGRMDEIVRAVRDCPSGALGVAFDGDEARGLADWHGQREPAIEITQDGPYRVTGAIELADAAGVVISRAAGASREHYALCRCGHSQNKPFCSGMHWYVDFRDPVRAPGAEPTLFEWAGGLPALTRMTRLLYEKHVPADDLLAPLYAAMPPGYPQHEAALLAEAFGRPAAAPDQPPAAQPGPGNQSSTPEPFTPEPFTPEQRARWVMLAARAADEAVLPAEPEFRATLASYLDWTSRIATAPSVPAATAPTTPSAPSVPAATAPAAGAAARAVPRWDWSPAGPPVEATAQAGATAEEPQVVLPSADETVSFAAHVKPLFREHDRKSMTFAFDLWSQTDVQTHAAEILDRLRSGTMPCDGAWPAEKIAVFSRWAETGFEA